MIQEQAEERGKEWFGELVPESWVLTVSRAATAFPPSIAVDGLETSVLGRRGAATTPLLWLFLWAAGGVAIGYGIVRRSLLGGEQAGRVSSTAVLRREGTIPLFSAERLTVFPAEVQAVAAKEMRYLLRSTSGKFNLVIMPIFVVVMALVVARDLDHSFLGLDRASLIFVGLMIYSSMFSNNFLFNAYAWERAGVQSYFLSPVLPERVVLGKNLGVWLYNLILGTEAVVVFSFMAGIPRAEVLIGGCLAFVASIGSATFVGNLLSPALPVPRDMASISNSPSQTAVLATFGVLVLNALLIGSSVSIPAILGAAWFGPILLALLIVAEIVAYGLMLPRFGHLLDSRREAIIEALRV
jgi:hypothetical protein